MQKKLLLWALVYPFGTGLAASLIATQMGSDPAGPEPGSGAVWFAWEIANSTWSWFSWMWGVLIWPGETVTGIPWAGASSEQAVLSVGVSYVVWAAVIPAGLSALGLWDWFGYGSRGRSVSQELNGRWVWLRDWFEEVTAFGKGPVSKWARMADMKARRWRRGDVFLGRAWTIFGGRSWPVGLSTEKHMVTIAGTGSGKSTAGLIPNLCLHEGSLLCIDPKGELARITAGNRRKRRRGKKGRHLVHVLDPFGISGKSTDSFYNPFQEMERAGHKNRDAVVSYASRIAEALVKPMSTTEGYWDKAAKTLLTGLVLYIFVHEPPERRNLLRLREFVTEGDVEGYQAAIDAGVFAHGDLNPFDFLIEKMKSVRKETHGEAIARAAGSIAMMGEGQRGSVLTTAQEHTAFLDNPLMARVVHGEGVGLWLDELKYGGVSVYVCLPVTAVNGPEGRWLRLFTLMFIEVMMSEPEKAPNPPVLLAIDEFPNLGRLDGIEVIAPMMRSYGVRFWAVGQDISQFKDVYPATWTGFIGGAEAVQFMGVTHPPTVDFIADLLGHHVVENGMGMQARREAHPLMDRDQVSRFLAKNRGNQIIWFGSHRPMKLKICPYFQYLMPWYYDPDPRYKEGAWRRLLRGMRG